MVADRAKAKILMTTRLAAQCAVSRYEGIGQLTAKGASVELVQGEASCCL